MRYAVITDSHVEALYGQTVCRHLQSKGFEVELFSFPAGEASKTRATKEKLEDALISHRYNRDTTILALGGGVVTDMAGFLAATFCRGVELVLIPTTLMGMVDASIGGKNGVNTPQGKNMIGSFYPPRSIVLQLGFLSTLPEKEWFNGAIEMLKAGLIADGEFFERFSEIPLKKAIARAIEIKNKILEHDPHERGVRRILNLGHTIGHALETLSNYQTSHGEAVAQGIVLESRIAYEMGILNKEALDKIEERLPPVAINFSPEEIVQALAADKKSSGGEPRFVLLEEIGAVAACGGEYCTKVPAEIIYKVLHDAAMCPC